MKTVKRTMAALCLTALLCCLLCVSAYATGTSGGTGDVASAVFMYDSSLSNRLFTALVNRLAAKSEKSDLLFRNMLAMMLNAAIAKNSRPAFLPVNERKNFRALLCFNVLDMFCYSW